jgi:hypothetical protein
MKGGESRDERRGERGDERRDDRRDEWRRDLTANQLRCKFRVVRKQNWQTEKSPRISSS